MKTGKLMLMAIALLTLQYQLNGQCSEMVWADEFDHSGLPDSTRWSYDVGGGGWGNSELQYYTDRKLENARIENGNLVIEAINETYESSTYTSARLVSKLKGDWLYGTVEVRAKLPGGKGTWAAIWMLPTDKSYGSWPSSGEIDIMEHVGYDEGNIHATLHTQAYNHTLGTQKGGSKMVSDACDTFHVYKSVWTPEKFDFYVDDAKYYTFNNPHIDYTTWPFDKRFHLVLNLAVGGSWGGAQGVDPTAFPAKMEIDYVRIFQTPENLVIHGPETVSPLQENVRFFLSNDPEASYSWSLKGEGELLSAADSNEVLIRWGCSADTVMCHLVTSCDTYDLELPVGLTDCSINGPAFIEASQQNILFTTPELQGSSYNWTVPEGVTISSGQGNDSLYANWGTFPGTLSLAVTNTCGTFEASRKIRFYGQYSYPDPDVPHPVPGTLNPTEFDYGGEGVAYHDAETANQGSGPRGNEGVDTEYGDLGTANVGWIMAGEWLKFSIRVAQEDIYMASMRVASNQTPHGPLRMYINGENRIPDIQLPLTGSWSTFSTVIAHDIPFYTTDTMLMLYAPSGGFNLGAVTFSTNIPSLIRKAGQNPPTVYPNPFHDRAVLQCDKPVKKVVLTDLYGKILQVIPSGEQTDKTLFINPDCGPGVYLLHVISDKEDTYVLKLIRN